MLAWKTKSVAPILAAGGVVLFASLVKYAQGQASKAEVEREIRSNIKDPQLVESYLELLEDDEIIESLRKVA